MQGSKQNIPAANKVLEIITPLNPEMRLVFQFGNWLPHDVGKKIDQTSTSTAVRLVSEWESMLGNFEKSDAKRPNIGGDGI